MTVENDKEVFLLLGRLEGKIDAVLVKQGEHTDKQDKLEARITRLEMRDNKQDGALLSILTAGKAAWAIIGAAAVYIYKLYLDK